MAVKQSGKDSAFRQFLSKNKSLVFMLPLLLVLVVVLVIIYTGGGGKKPAASTSTPQHAGSTASSGGSVPSSIEGQAQVEVLPILERISSGEDDSVVASQDPFQKPMKLTGIFMYADDDRSMAIIEYGGVSYIVRKNDVIGESPWSVAEIYENSVMLASEDKNILLELN